MLVRSSDGGMERADLLNELEHSSYVSALLLTHTQHTSYGAAIRELPELDATNHVTVSAAERQNNLIEQSHRPTRDQERQQRGFRTLRRTQAFLFTHAEVGDLFRHTRARTPARIRRRNWENAFSVWDKLSLSLP